MAVKLLITACFSTPPLALEQKIAFYDTGALLLNIVMKASYIFWLNDCPDSLSN